MGGTREVVIGVFLFVLVRTLGVLFWLSSVPPVFLLLSLSSAFGSGGSGGSCGDGVMCLILTVLSSCP